MSIISTKGSAFKVEVDINTEPDKEEGSSSKIRIHDGFDVTIIFMVDSSDTEFIFLHGIGVS